MADADNVDYLQEGFDPWSLTVPRLRSILVTHNISYPATAKKPQLVELFEEEIVPQAKKILDRRARAKRSSLGIVDAESSQDTAIPTGDLLSPPATASKSRSRSPKKAPARPIKKESVEPEHHEAPRAASPTKRKSRSASHQEPGPLSDTDGHPEFEAEKPTRKPRRRDVTPRVKEEDFADDVMPDSVLPARTTDDEDSVFTSDNPFQSGSSPPVPPKSVSGSRRKTTGLEPARKSTTPSARRRTDGPITDDEHSAAVTSFEIPVSKLNGVKKEETPAFEAGEEFTPEAQLELAQEEAESRAAVIRHRTRSSKRGFSLWPYLYALTITLLGAYGGWYRQEKIAVGYCGLGRPATSVVPEALAEHLPDWAIALAEPPCEPCPQHAYCYNDFLARCEPDFILKPHPLSLGGLVPVPPTCEPDGEKVRRIQVVADKAVEELRERRAKFECGDLVDEQGNQEETPAVTEEVLKETISAKRSKKMNAQEFDDLWASALGEIKSRDEVVVETPEESAGSGSVSTTLTSTSLARVPFTCAIRRSLRLGLARYRLTIAGIVLSVLLALYGRYWWRAHRATAARIPALVDVVLERLSAQKELALYYEGVSNNKDGEAGGEDAFLFLPNLRDDVLRSVHSVAERERIWQRVRAVVEQNSNVRTGQREGRNGEVGRAWEWIGPLGGGSGDTPGGGQYGGHRRRKSGRVSWGPGVKGDPDDEIGATAGGDGSRPEMAENNRADRASIHRRWEEPGSRPIY